MAKTIGDFFVQRLLEWSVRGIYGYPGDCINGALLRKQVLSAAERGRGVN